MDKHIDVLNAGYVELCNLWGDDYTILESARISTGGEAKKGDVADQGLINYMYKNEHTSPFESVIVRLRLKMPLFVARQWVRHRTQALNEYSGRYSPMIEEQYIPEHFKYQAKKNHQGSGAEVEDQVNVALTDLVEENHLITRLNYRDLLDEGVSKEQARIVLPVAQYTLFYSVMSLHNLFHLLKLRYHSHAQWEIQQYAQAIITLLKQEESIKWSMEVFLNKLEIDYLYMDALNKYKGNDFSKLKKALEEFINSKED